MFERTLLKDDPTVTVSFWDKVDLHNEATESSENDVKYGMNDYINNIRSVFSNRRNKLDINMIINFINWTMDQSVEELSSKINGYIIDNNEEPRIDINKLEIMDKNNTNVGVSTMEKNETSLLEELYNRLNEVNEVYVAYINENIYEVTVFTSNEMHDEKLMEKLLDIEETVEGKYSNKFFDFKYIPGNYPNPERLIDRNAFLIFKRGGN